MLSAVVRRVGVAQVDLVLAGARLVVAELHRDAEVLEHPHRAAAEVVGRAAGDVVEVPGRVDRLRPVDAVLGRLQQVELDLRMRVEREAALRRLRQRALEHVPRVGDGRLPVRRGDVAEHPRGEVDLAAPRQDLEGRGVRMRQHVGLERAGQALDGRAVESDALAEGALDLGRRDRDRLQRADHVGEPQSHELDLPLFDGAKNEVALLVHQPSFHAPAWDIRLAASGPVQCSCSRGIDDGCRAAAGGSAAESQTGAHPALPDGEGSRDRRSPG